MTPTTRATNKTAHPGRPDMAAPRRSSEEVQAEVRITAAAEKEAEKRKLAAICKVVALENKIHIDQAQSDKVASHPPPSTIKKKARTLVLKKKLSKEVKSSRRSKFNMSYSPDSCKLADLFSCRAWSTRYRDGGRG